MTPFLNRLNTFPAFVLDALIVLGIFAASLGYYGNLYVSEESKFAFYQKYFHSAVNIYCLKDPDVRNHNGLIPEINERLDLAKVDCRELAKSPPIAASYFNGWHDTHPVISTLMGHTWRWLGFDWASLWPVAGLLGGLTVASFYLILRGFGLPWHVALLLFPSAVPFAFLQSNFYFLRDFSKVPFILLAFAALGPLFKPGTSAKQRLFFLCLSTTTVVLGVGFRQDALVILPTIVAAAVLTSFKDTRHGSLRLGSELAAITACFVILTLAVQGLKTTQVAQLQGYPHFIVQGFADPFWKEARTEVPGVSFLGVYSDMLAWAAVDANSSERVGYFAALDPLYTSSGFDLIAKYTSLSIADAIVRVFTGLSAISHGYWIVDKVGIWTVLLLALIAFGKWRLSYFLTFAIVTLAAAGSLQFSPRHSLHLIALDRALAIIMYAALLEAIWRQILIPTSFNIRFGILSGLAAAGLVTVAICGSYAVQRASTTKLKEQLESLNWLPSADAYSSAFPRAKESVLRVIFDGSKCSAGQPEVVMVIDGEKVVRPIARLGNTARPIYFAILDPAISKSSIEITPADCVTKHSWAFLGDGILPPVQMFDPQQALQHQTLWRLFLNLGNAVR